MTDRHARPTDSDGLRNTPPYGRAKKSRLGRESLLTLASLVANGLGRVATGVAVGRISGSAALGVFQAGLSVAQIAGLFGPSPLGSTASSYIARRRAAEDRDGTRLVTEHLTVRLLQSGALVVPVATLIWLSVLGHDAGSALGFAAVAASFCLYSFARGALYGSGRAIRAAWWNIGTSVLGVVLVGAAVWMNLGAGWVLAVFSLNYFIFAGANWARAKPRLDRGDLGREMDRFTVYGIMGTVASAGFLNAAVVLAAVVGTPTEAGHFSAAFVLATPASLIGGTASLILFPLLSGLRATESEDDRANLVDLSSRTLAVPVVTLFSVLILLRHELIDIVWGSSYEPATSILTPLLFALLLTTLAIPAVNALTTFSARGVRQSAISSASGFMVGAVVWSLFVPAFGVDAVAYGFLAGSGVSSVVPFLITARAIGRSWSRHAAKVGAAIAMLGFASIAQSSLVTGAHADGFILVIYLLFWSFANRTEVLRLTTAGARAFSRSR